MMNERQNHVHGLRLLERARAAWSLSLLVAALSVPATPQASQSSGSGTVALTNEELQTVLTLSPLDPSRAADPTNRHQGQSAAIEFGRELFYDKRLSRNGRLSCATCHQPERGWADGLPLAAPDTTVGRHTPSLWNVSFNRWFNWDGRVDSLWAQALGPIESPNEMANDRVNLVRLVIQDRTLHRRYLEVFGDFPPILDPATLPASALPGPTDSDSPQHQAWAKLTAKQQTAINRVFTNLGKAIAAFEATIISSESAFDRFVDGLRTGDTEKLAALSDSAKRGLKIFVGDAKCVVCHAGPTFSDLEFHNVLLPSVNETSVSDKGRYNGIAQLRKSPFNSSSAYNDAAPGDYVDWVTYLRRTVENRRQFKTPMLRNVVSTAPYMHTGQFSTLSDTIDHCGSMDEFSGEDEHSEVVLSPVELTEADVEDVTAFLESLTDERFLESFNHFYPKDHTRQPPAYGRPPLSGRNAAQGRRRTQQPDSAYLFQELEHSQVQLNLPH